MAVMSTVELAAYYRGLLIIQYNNKPKAQGTIEALTAPLLIPQTSVQVIGFSPAPTEGSFTLRWGTSTVTLDWDATAVNVETALRTIEGLGAVTVTGDAVAGFKVTFHSVPSPASLLGVTASSLDSVIGVTETDVTLPIGVEYGFNLTGDNPAKGKQLDLIGKYVGVTRTAQGVTGTIQLDDAQFLKLIQLAIATNSLTSDLYSIQTVIKLFFDGEIRVYDYQNMTMSYVISEGLGSLDLIQMFIVQGLLPRPMAVQVSAIVYAPNINNFFGFCTYETPNIPNNVGMNTYEDFSTEKIWLLYENGVSF